MSDANELLNWVQDARQRTFELIADLADTQLLGPQFAIVNPLLWEIGHVAWFQEKWVLRHARHEAPLQPHLDAFYDSAAIAHDDRWQVAFTGSKTNARLFAQRAGPRYCRTAAAFSDGSRSVLHSTFRVPRGHAYGGVHLHAPNVGLSGTSTCRRANRPASHARRRVPGTRP